MIFTSAAAADSLIGRWEALNVDVWDAVQSGGNVDLGKALNNGAVVRTPPEDAGPADGLVRVRVYDDDWGTPDDPAGTVNLLLSELVEGDNDLTYPGNAAAEETGVVRRLSVRVTDREVPVRNLLEMLRAP